MRGAPRMKTIPAKSILSGYGDGWFGSNYNMNLYKGCSHGCIYCDSRSECYRINDFDTVRAKADALTILENDLRSKRKKGIIHSGAMSDPYNPFEKDTEISRGALRLIEKYGFGVVIATKSDLILRDKDILKSIQKHAPAFVNFTVTTADDDLCRRIERHVCPSSSRFRALRELSDAGIEGGILLMPILPFINDTPENILSIVSQAHEAHARYIYPAFGVTLRQNQREYFFDRLDEDFPGMKEQYLRYFGDAYSCESPRRGELNTIFTAECKKRGILYKMDDISKYIRKGYDREQMSLF